MKNFKKLTIENFQTHRHTEIDFADTITVFVGKTDSGKTAIFRALKLLIKNKPRGTGYICVFAPKDKKNKPTAKVSLTFSDDTVVERVRAENVNKYVLKTEKGEEVFENFGINIPPEIAENIFTPFFTTKRDGSGIGLAVSKQIIRLHGGSLHLVHNGNGKVAFLVVLE